MNIQIVSNDKPSSINAISLDTPAPVVGVSEDNLYDMVRLSTEIIIKKGYSPFINEETGTWFEYDDDKHGFVDTGVVAAGSGGTTALVFKNRFEFPNIGSESVLYIAKDENAIYRFSATDNTYIFVGTDYHEVESIQCKLREEI